MLFRIVEPLLIRELFMLDPEFDLMFEFIMFEFIMFEFMLPELLMLPEFMFDVLIGVELVVVDELFDIIIEFELEFEFRAFEFILLSAPPHASIAADPARHRPVKRSFLIFLFVLSSIILTDRRAAKIKSPQEINQQK